MEGSLEYVYSIVSSNRERKKRVGLCGGNALFCLGVAFFALKRCMQFGNDEVTKNILKFDDM